MQEEQHQRLLNEQKQKFLDGERITGEMFLDFPETDGSVPVNAPHMPVECPFGSDMDVKTVPSGDFKEHSSRDPFPVQEFLFLFIEQLGTDCARLFLRRFLAFLKGERSGKEIIDEICNNRQTER